MWGLYYRIDELEAEVRDLKQRLQNALLVNEQRLDEIQDLRWELLQAEREYRDGDD